jgi:hypothetical protein
LPSPSTDRYSTFRRRSTLEGSEYNNIGTPDRLIEKTKGVLLPITKLVRDFAHTMTKELQEEENRSKDATDAINSLSERFSALEERVTKLREKIQEPEAESVKTRGVTTKGQYVTFRELIGWGAKQNTIIDKTVQAYNQKVGASGGRRTRAANVRRQASIVLHMEVHVSDMLDWQAALGSIPDNLADNYPLIICLAETAFEEVFGFHPTDSGSGIFQNEHCGKPNYNLASSLVLY